MTNEKKKAKFISGKPEFFQTIKNKGQQISYKRKGQSTKD